MLDEGIIDDRIGFTQLIERFSPWESRRDLLVRPARGTTNGEDDSVHVVAHLRNEFCEIEEQVPIWGSWSTQHARIRVGPTITLYANRLERQNCCDQARAVQSGNVAAIGSFYLF